MSIPRSTLVYISRACLTQQTRHPAKRAPVIQDGEVLLAETGAIIDYILAKYGNGRLTVSPSDANFADYLYYMHFANGTLQPALLIAGRLSSLQLPADNASLKRATDAVLRCLDILEERLGGDVWLAGDEFTAADITIFFSLTTMRLFYPYSLEDYKAISRYLGRVGQRESYQRAMARGDPGLTPVLSPEKPVTLREQISREHGE